jgi:uncharacterized protein YpmB
MFNYDSIDAVSKLHNQLQLVSIILVILAAFASVFLYIVDRRLDTLESTQKKVFKERLGEAEKHTLTSDGALVGKETEYTIYEGGTDRQNLDIRDPVKRSIKWHIEFFSERITKEGFDLRVYASQVGGKEAINKTLHVAPGDTIEISGTPFHANIVRIVETVDKTLNYATFSIAPIRAQ